LFDQLDCFCTVGSLADNLDVTFVVENPGQAIGERVVIIDNKSSDNLVSGRWALSDLVKANNAVPNRNRHCSSFE